jgi:hypothetical protein
VLKLRPISLREANAHIAEHHAHHPLARGCKFVIGCYEDDDVRLCGVVVVERPKARMLQDGETLELSRVCTDRTRHVASKLIAAATRAAFAMGATRVISYILDSEQGVSYEAAGWKIVEGRDGKAVEAGGGSWSRDGRERDTLGLFGDVPKAPQAPKHRWEKIARGGHHAAPVTFALPPGESDEPYVESGDEETVAS